MSNRFSENELNQLGDFFNPKFEYLKDRIDLIDSKIEGYKSVQRLAKVDRDRGYSIMGRRALNLNSVSHPEVKLQSEAFFFEDEHE